VAWLSTLDPLYDGDEEDGGDRLEPPVPPALAESSDLLSLAEFLEVEAPLVAAAAEGAASEGDAEVTPSALKRWIAAQPAAKQHAWLTRVATGGGAEVEAELVAAFQRATAPEAGRAPRRTLSALITRAQEIHELRRKRAGRRR